MESLLSTLQNLQTKAFKKGVHAFDITTRHFSDGSRGISVSVFLAGDDSDGDYGAFYFYDFSSAFENLRILNNLKAFIGED